MSVFEIIAGETTQTATSVSYSALLAGCINMGYYI
jgi:hypothetical protein